MMGMFVNNDFSKLSSSEQEEIFLRIDFCRFLYLRP